MMDFLKLIFFGISKAPTVELVLPKTGDVVHIRTGFNTVFFLFSGLGGLPLFFKGLWDWGLIMLGITIYNQYLQIQLMQQMADAFSYAALFNIQDNPIETLTNILSVVFSIVLGIKGNAWVAQRLFAKGWRFADPESKAAANACKKWHISKYYLHPNPAVKDRL